MNGLAWNPLAAAVLFDSAAVPAEARNLVWLTFMDDGFRARHTRIHDSEAATLGCFRRELSLHPDPRSAVSPRRATAAAAPLPTAGWRAVRVLGPHRPAAGRLLRDRLRRRRRPLLRVGLAAQRLSPRGRPLSRGLCARRAVPRRALREDAPGVLRRSGRHADAPFVQVNVGYPLDSGIDPLIVRNRDLVPAGEPLPPTLVEFMRLHAETLGAGQVDRFFDVLGAPRADRFLASSRSSRRSSTRGSPPRFFATTSPAIPRNHPERYVPSLKCAESSRRTTPISGAADGRPRPRRNRPAPRRPGARTATASDSLRSARTASV